MSSSFVSSAVVRTFSTEEGMRLFFTEEVVKTFFAGVEMELFSAEEVMSFSSAGVMKLVHRRCVENLV